MEVRSSDSASTAFADSGRFRRRDQKQGRDDANDGAYGVQLPDVALAYRAGDEKTAREHFDRTIMAVNRLGNQGGDIFYAMHKQLLVRQGVIRTAFVRSPTTAIDPITARELDELIAQVVPLAKAFTKLA